MKLLIAIGLCIFASSSVKAQSATSAPAKKYAPVCGKGVKVFDDIKQVPVPHDTIQVPAPDGPIRVSNEAEAEAAELQLRARAGTVGATGVLVTTAEDDDGAGRVTMRRQVIGIYVRSDSASAQKACAK
jgi:hypothetical protein